MSLSQALRNRSLRLYSTLSVMIAHFQNSVPETRADAAYRSFSREASSHHTQGAVLQLRRSLFLVEISGCCLRRADLFWHVTGAATGHQHGDLSAAYGSQYWPACHLVCRFVSNTDEDPCRQGQARNLRPENHYSKKSGVSERKRNLFSDHSLGRSGNQL